ncbi:MAG: rRNA maturation RNase YbeY [Alphaproteobacteria bacterium]|nr:rRNA maturation RNase YbeY [Alphaproteobacteria bacterium]
MDIDILREDSFKWQNISDLWFIDRLTQLTNLLKDYSFGDAELSIVLANNKFVQNLNKEYRGKDQPTNVLSFPADDTNGYIIKGPLGDIVFAHETIMNESDTESKHFEAHLTHLLLHGLLHLLGYDHIEDHEAQEMERIEIEILQKIGIKNPYL